MKGEMDMFRSWPHYKVEVEVPKNSAEWRKQRPICTGVLDYFPDAILSVAYCSYIGNEQHNPGEPLHWAKEKSTDEEDAMLRHTLERGTRDTDGVRHSAKRAWRALAALQREIDHERKTTPADCDQSAKADTDSDSGKGKRLSGESLRELDSTCRRPGDVSGVCAPSVEYPVRPSDSDRGGVA